MIPRRSAGAASMRPVSRKMGIKDGTRAFFVGAPESAPEAIDVPNLEIASGLAGDFHYIHVFAVTQAGMDDLFPRLRSHLKPSGMLWVSWPKGKHLGIDLSLPSVIRIGYSHGLVESTCPSVDAT